MSELHEKRTSRGENRGGTGAAKQKEPGRADRLPLLVGGLVQDASHIYPRPTISCV
jgi:hypothetical protein